jgi:DNA modification methylase
MNADPRTMAGTIPVYCAFDKLVPTDKLLPNPRNPNTHPDAQITLLAKVIAAQGWRAPVTVSKRSGLIVRGHGRYQAALRLGTPVVPVDFQDYDSDEAEWADLIADNRLAELAVIDTNRLNELLRELQDGAVIDMDLTGFDSDALNAMLAPDDDTEDNFDVESAVKAIATPVTKPGDVIILGRHKLLCGDSTDAATVAAFMGEERARCLFTDPPYGVSYQGGDFDVIAGDEMRGDALRDFLTRAFSAASFSLVQNPALYICYATVSRAEFEDALNAAGFRLKQELIWHKQMVLGRSDYHWNHEPIIYGTRIGTNCEWYGDRTQKTVLDYQEQDLTTLKKAELLSILTKLVQEAQTSMLDIKRDPAKSYVHPTQKPVALPARLIHNSTRVGDLVYDGFLGSGSTLIACEKTGRSCRGIELDPRYCDAVVTRWEQLTGGTAERVPVALRS